MTSHEATVSTLTAEVRVLMVGNRQITQSVAKQLDVVPIGQLEAFGRVSIKIDGGGGPWVIGKHNDTGALALSEARIGMSRTPYVELTSEKPGDLPIVCNRIPRRGVAYLRFGDTRFYLETFQRCPGNHPLGGESCGWDANGRLAEIERQVLEYPEKYKRRESQVEHARSLPLIVLAGLR